MHLLECPRSGRETLDHLGREDITARRRLDSHHRQLQRAESAAHLAKRLHLGIALWEKLQEIVGLPQFAHAPKSAQRQEEMEKESGTWVAGGEASEAHEY